LLLISSLLIGACTNADLYLDLEPEASVMRVAIKAKVCAPEPIVEQVPYKILFVIDTSLSNRWNDPEERRVDAFVEAVEQHVAKGQVFFGVVTFNDYAHRPTLVFTDNKQILLTAADTLTGEFAGGGTNYEDAIHEMYQFIVDDLDSLASPQEARRTHYLVYWLSDGLPTFGTTDRPTLVANVEAVAEYFQPKVAEFRLNTLYLESSGEWESEDEILYARLLLQEMAEAGGGQFTNISSGQEFSFAIDPTPQVRSFRFSKAVASNIHAQFGPRHALPDSDGDGLLDEEEIVLGLDPTLADSDGDFYRDGIEFKSGWLAPGQPDPGCATDDLDSDGDGLRDCEERVIGSDPYDPDSDDDFLLDGIEFLLDGTPLSDEPTSDSDLDGLPDAAEVIAHLDPRQDTDEDDQQLWAYRYELLGDEVDADGGRHCYRLQVDNIAVYQTLETPLHPRGWQLLDLVVAFETEDGQDLVQFYRARGKVGFLFPGEVHPPSALIEFTPADFQLLEASCPSGGPGCHLPPQQNCGDGLLDPGEECDAASLGGASCESLGYLAGKLACDQTCRLDTSGCISYQAGSCGNGVREGEEECDGDDLGGLGCASLGLLGEGLACDDDCRLDDSSCRPATADCPECFPAGPRGSIACASSGASPAASVLPCLLPLLFIAGRRRKKTPTAGWRR